jgi:2-dehydropantoate 2-reductase
MVASPVAMHAKTAIAVPFPHTQRNTILKICIFGAGAVGGHFAARLAAAGNDVSVVARGPNLTAIRDKGLILHSGEQRIAGRVRASDNPADLGPQDAILVTLKATGLASLAEGVTPLLGKDTAVVFAQNGLPWWYAQGLAPSRPRPPDLSRLDPGGVLARSIAPERVVGGVIFSANTVVEPGVISNATPQYNCLTLGEPDDRPSARLDALRSTLVAAGILSPQVDDIRAVVWNKLLMNFMSLFAALAEQPGKVMMADADLGALIHALIREGIAIGAAHGVALEPVMPNTTMHKPSIWQDYEKGRPMEVEALAKAPLAFARAAGVAAPILEVVVALLAHRARAKGLYQG